MSFLLYHAQDHLLLYDKNACLGRPRSVFNFVSVERNCRFLNNNGSYTPQRNDVAKRVPLAPMELPQSAFQRYEDGHSTLPL